MASRKDAAPDHGLGTLTSMVPVRLIDVSRSGCLLEANRQIPAGTTGRFRLEIGGRAYTEEVRITRCRSREGSASVWRIGAEFLHGRRPDATSLRRAVHALIDRGGTEEPVAFVSLR